MGLVAALAVQSAWAHVTASGEGTIRACVSHGGQVRIADARRWERCPESRRLEWNIQGVPGPTGPSGPAGPSGERGPKGEPGTSSLVSPNGRFRIDISDRGIYLRGPGGTVYVDRFGTGAAPGNLILGR